MRTIQPGIFSFGAAILALVLPANHDETPKELGRVTWQRDLSSAKKQSAENGKPVLVLFQEVPG